MIAPQLPHSAATNAGALVMHSTVQGLRRHHDVTVACFVGASTEDARACQTLVRDGLNLFTIPRQHHLLPGARKLLDRLHPSWLRGEHPLAVRGTADGRMQGLIDWLCVTRGFDLVQIEYSTMGCYRLPPRIPILLTEHEVPLVPLYDERQTAPDLVRRWLRDAEWHRWCRFARQLWRRCRRIQVFAQRDAAAILDTAPEVADRVRINPFGLPLPHPFSLAREAVADVVFVGWFGHPPNVDAAVWLGQRLMPRLRARIAGVRLVLVGKHPPQAVTALACDDIVVTGAVEDIQPYLERATVVVAPLQRGGGMRLKVLQALAAGKAVVVSPRAAEGLFLGAGAPLCIADDTDAFVDAVRILIEQPERRRALGDRARQWVATYYSEDAFWQRLDALYNEMLSASNGIPSTLVEARDDPMLKDGAA